MGLLMALSWPLFIDPRKEAAEGQELWYLAPIRLAFGNA